MAAEPSRLELQEEEAETEGSDMDAEPEEDLITEEASSAVEEEVQIIGPEGSEADAEGEELDEDEDNGEAVGAVKFAALDSDSEEEEAEPEVVSLAEAQSDEEEGDSDESSDAESEAANEWEGESDGAEEVETAVADPNRCVFCGEDELHDPSEEFEEYLACAVCGDNEGDHWRCKDCVNNGLEEDQKEVPNATARRRASAPKIARDLLPSNRAIKPDSHSVFNKLILDDDPMDGSRSLRKRKSSSDGTEEPVRPGTRKRRKASTNQEADQPVPANNLTVPIVTSEKPGEVLKTVSDREDFEDVRSTRPRRQKQAELRLVDILESDKNSLVVCIKVDGGRLVQIDRIGKKKQRRRERDRARRAQAQQSVEAGVEETPHQPPVHVQPAPAYVAPFYAFNDRESDELKSKPYGGILSEAEANTEKTYPQAADRKRFEDARQKAEEDWKRKAMLTNGTEPARQKVSSPPSKIKCINFGGYEIDTWHAAPYPEEYSRNRVLYICEFCLKYMNSDYVAWRHKLKCPGKHPPGDEIYRDGSFSFFEVDGRKNPVYCQNLCLLAKLFLGSKTLYYDVEPFLFYVMTENDDYGCHFVGYFSKEKRPSSLNNVSCILVLPIHQRRGFGHLLIEFSYLLTRVEKKTGSPEKPLSDMGLVSYRSYWRLVLCSLLLDQKSPVSVSTISERTGMTADDIVSALEAMRALIRDPVTKQYALRLDYGFYKEYTEKYAKKGYTKINPDALIWTPYVMGRNNLAHYDEVPVQTIAPREGEDDEAAVQPEEGVQLEQQNGGFDPEVAIMSNGNLDSENPDTQQGESNRHLALTPQPSFSRDSPSGSKLSPAKSGYSTPNGYRNSQESGSTSVIPPTRFEVFPPIPGTTQKRRPGRPFARGGSRRTSTPVRRGIATPSTVRPSTVRRTRSKLGSVVNGARTEDEDESDTMHVAARMTDNTVEKAAGQEQQLVHGAEEEAEEEEEDIIMEDD
ncbi:hypothetical protein B0A49_10383 [Cryomyces minteri]|nr:hypothetical protein B0A49_10383 [Cryomyces minteri]